MCLPFSCPLSPLFFLSPSLSPFPSLPLSADEVVLRPHGSDITPDWFVSNGFNKPMIVNDPTGLDIKVPPPDFTIMDVERYVGNIIIVHSSCIVLYSWKIL